jgi:ABC-type multidrug transport system fused ATPase/permease subunit
MIGDIYFKDVHFRYGTRVNVFEGLNLEMKKGQDYGHCRRKRIGQNYIAIADAEYLPAACRARYLLAITILKYITNESLRKMVAVVPQEVHLFGGNVIENIAVGDQEPDMKRVMQICRELEITDFIERLPNGFNTFLGENGTNLSGGQRQRIAIARALYREPEILILDEATSSLDSESEQHVQNAIALLREKQKTIIVIAHRLSTIMHADKIVVLQTGKLVEEGNHHDLMNAKGQYHKMWQKQFPSEETIIERAMQADKPKARVRKAKAV